MYHLTKLILFFIVFVPMSNIFGQFTSTKFLDELPIKTYADGIQSVVANVNQKGNLISLGGKVFKKGIGLESTSVMAFLLDKNGGIFSAEVGVDDLGNDSIPLRFYVLADKNIIFDSGEMLPGINQNRFMFLLKTLID